MKPIFLNENPTKEEPSKDVTAEKTSTYKLSRMVIDFIKSLYKKDDEELLGEGENILRKLIALGLAVAAVFTLPFNAGVTAIVAALAWYIDRIIDGEYTKKQKAQLLLKIETELEIINDRIEKAKEKNNAKEKENLIKIRNVLTSKANTLRKMGTKSELENKRNDDD